MKTNILFWIPTDKMLPEDNKTKIIIYCNPGSDEMMWDKAYYDVYCKWVKESTIRNGDLEVKVKSTFPIVKYWSDFPMCDFQNGESKDDK